MQQMWMTVVAEPLAKRILARTMAFAGNEDPKQMTLSVFAKQASAVGPVRTRMTSVRKLTHAKTMPSVLDWLTHTGAIVQKATRGPNCESETIFDECADFHGDGWIALSRDRLTHAASNVSEVIRLSFLTKHHEGLLLFQGQPRGVDAKGQDYISLGLKNGYLEFSYEMGGGPAEIVSEERVDDGRMHTVELRRTGKRGTLKVDTKEVHGESLGLLVMLNTKSDIFIGELFPRDIGACQINRPYSRRRILVSLASTVTRSAQQMLTNVKTMWEVETTSCTSGQATSDLQQSSCSPISGAIFAEAADFPSFTLVSCAILFWSKQHCVCDHPFVLEWMTVCCKITKKKAPFGEQP
ncbi:hypothetical protein MRX96_004083 [Rhipicephalus microplus]